MSKQMLETKMGLRNIFSIYSPKKSVEVDVDFSSSPAIVKMDFDGYRSHTTLYKSFPDFKLHREDGPAKIVVNTVTKDVTREWYRHGKLCREGGPA